MAVRRCQRLVVHVTMFYDSSFGVVVVRYQLLLCASLYFTTAAFLLLIELVDAPLVELIELSWVVVGWPCRKRLTSEYPDTSHNQSFDQILYGEETRAYNC